MSDETLTKPTKKRHTVLVQIVTAALSAFTAVSIAKLHENTEIAKAKLGYEELAKHVNEIQDLTAKHNDALAKISGTVETMNGILQTVFMSQSGLKIRSYAPPIPTYAEHVGGGRPPKRIIVPRHEKLPPPKEAASAAVQQLQTLSTNTKTEEVKAVKVEPVPVKLEQVTDKK